MNNAFNTLYELGKLPVHPHDHIHMYIVIYVCLGKTTH